MRQTRYPATRKLMASIPIAASRPIKVETSPPAALPTAAIVPQVDSMRNVASARSSGATTAGIAADDAGLIRADSAARMANPVRARGTLAPARRTAG